MLYYLLFPLRDSVGALNVFRYPSFRALGAVTTALLIALLFGPRLIAWLRVWQHGVSNVREDTPESHKKKAGTPSMGGLLILLALGVSVLLWGDLQSKLLWAAVFITFGFGAVGFFDDFYKYKRKDSKGISGKMRLLIEGLLVVCVAWFLGVKSMGGLLDTTLSLPFVSITKFNPDIGLFYLPFAYIVIVGTSNAVNFTDGLDGLAIGPAIVSAATFMVLSYAAGTFIDDFDVARYLRIEHIEGAAELAVFAAAFAGAGMGFLWFNAYPAEVFMGDVGALALGGGLGALAVLTKMEFVSAIIHGLFLAEIISVILQVGSFKLTGKRIFKMAPLHHHFELKGWQEQKIVVRFWLISVFLALIGLMTLKVR